MIYDTDLIDIISITNDPKYGNETKVTQENIVCRIEENNKIIKNANGENIKANSLILMAPSIVIKKGDRIVIKQQKEINTDDTREYEVIQIFTAGGFMATHKEVLI